MNEVVSIAYAAERVLGGVGESTLRRWIGEGRIPVVRLGRRLFIRIQALEAFIKTGEHKDGGEKEANCYMTT